MLFDPHRSEILLAEVDHALVRYRNLVIQVRRGEMTRQLMKRMADMSLKWHAGSSGNVAYVGILEAGAPLSDAALRKEQGVLLRGVMDDPRTHVVGVTIDDSLKSKMVASILRLMVMGNKRFHVASNLPSASQWLAERIDGHQGSEILSAMEFARGVRPERQGG